MLLEGGTRYQPHDSNIIILLPWTQIDLGQAAAQTAQRPANVVAT